jgi:hypothetical protein
MNTKATVPPAAPEAQESYIVSEGKKRGSTRDVREEAAFDRYYTVMRVHGGDAILTDNWHTNEVLSHARNNFEGVTFAMRTLEAWGANLGNGSRALGRQEEAAARHRERRQEVECLRTGYC